MKIILNTLIAIIPALAWSQSYQLGAASTFGNGCQAGTVSVTVSPDASAVSVLFDDFNVDASGALGKDRSFKTSCRVVIPVTVTAGYTIETTRIDYRGFTALDDAVATITTYANRTAEMSGPRFGVSTVFRGPIQDMVFAQHSVPQNAGFKRCPGVEQIYLGITAQINTVRRKAGTFTLDSADIGGDGVTLKVVLKPCRL